MTWLLPQLKCLRFEVNKTQAWPKRLFFKDAAWRHKLAYSIHKYWLKGKEAKVKVLKVGADPKMHIQFGRSLWLQKAEHEVRLYSWGGCYYSSNNRTESEDILKFRKAKISTSRVQVIFFPRCATAIHILDNDLNSCRFWCSFIRCILCALGVQKP